MIKSLVTFVENVTYEYIVVFITSGNYSNKTVFIEMFAKFLSVTVFLD